MAIELAWIVNYHHSSDVFFSDAKYVTSANTNALYQSLRAPFGFNYTPVRLILAPSFHAALAAEFADWPLVKQTPNQPYCVDIGLESPIEVSLSALVFEPRIISLSVKIKSDLPLEIRDLSENPNFLNLRDHRKLDSLIKAAIGLIVSNDVNGMMDCRYDYVPIVNAFDIASNHFPTWQENNKQEIARVLIRNVASGPMRDELVEKLYAKAEQFNHKSDSEYLLLDKQSLLMVSASAESPAVERSRKGTLNSAIALMTLGLVYRSFLLHFLQFRIDDRDTADYILSRISPWCSHPSAMLQASVTNRHLWELITSEFQVSELHSLVLSRKYISDAVSSGLERYDRVGNDEGRWIDRLKDS